MRKLLFVLILLPFLSGCSKEEDNKPTVSVVNGGQCSPQTIVVGNDSTTFQYDLNGNLIREDLYEGNVFIDSYKYEYTGSKISKIIQLDKNGRAITEYTVAYDNQGNIISASSPAITYALTYSNSLLATHTRTTNGNMDNKMTYQYSGSEIAVNNMVVEVDNKPNPFAASIRNLVIEGYYFKNNITKESYKNSSGQITDTNLYQYQYNENGYPVTGTRTFPSGNVQQIRFNLACK